MKKEKICSWCIQGLKNHGEKIYVGDLIDPNDYETEPYCDECGCIDEELYEVIWEV